MSVPAPQPYSLTERRWVLGVIIVVALVHLTSFLYFKHLDAEQPDGPRYPVMGGDATYYTRVADNLLRYGVFTDSPQDLAPTDANLPAYPFLLAVSKGFTGSFVPLLLPQMLVVLTAVFLIHAIARRFVPWKFALTAALLYGIEPMAVLANTAFLTDGLFAALLVVLVYIGFVQRAWRGWRRAAATGLLLGVLAMLRPTGGLLVPVALFFFVVQEWLETRSERWQQAFLAGFFALACAGLVTVPWIMRNHELFGRYEIFHSGSHVMLDYDVRPFLAWRALQAEGQTSVYYPARHLQDPVFALVDAQIKTRLVEMTPAGEDHENYVSRLAITLILHDPIRYAYFHIAHVPVYLFASGIAAYDQFARMELARGGGLSESTMYKVITAVQELQHGTISSATLWAGAILGEVALWMTVVLLAAIGLFVHRRSLVAWLFAVFIAYFALITGPVTVARYRISAEPFLLMLAMCGLYAVGSRALSAYRSRRAGISDPDVALFVRFVRYLAAGAIVFLVNLVSYTFFVKTGMWYVAATVASFFCGFLVSFALQKFFAFRDQQGPGRGQQIALYLLLLLFNAVANTVFIVFFVGYIGESAIVGIFAANVFIAVWNFFIYDRVLFTERELRAPALPTSLAGSLTDISIVVPCHNEAESVGAVLDSIPRGIGEVIVVDNDSTDNTAAVASARGARVVYEHCRGYGAAVKAGMRVAHGNIIAIIDGDNQHPASELPRMLHMLEAEQLDFISAARFPLSDTWLRGFGNWGLTLIVNLLFGLSLTDSQSGMVLFRRPLLPQIEPQRDDSAFVQELKIRAAKATGSRFAEVRIPCIPRAHGVSKLKPLRHGIRLLIALIALRAHISVAKGKGSKHNARS